MISYYPYIVVYLKLYSDFANLEKTGGFLTGGFANLKTKKLALAWPQGPRSAPPAECFVLEY